MMSRTAGLVVWLSVLIVASTGAAQSPADLVRSGHVRIEASLDTEAVLVGQRAVLRITVFTRTWYLEAPAFPETLNIDDAIVLRPDSFAVNSRKRIDGESYAGQTRSYAIFPVAPGTLEIPPVDVVLVVARDDASRSDPVTLRTAPLQLDVSVPEAARGHGLVVATPKLEVEQTWTGDLEELRVGDSLRRTLTQRVTDSVAMVLPRPELVAPTGVSVYPERPEITTESQRGVLSGRRVDAATFVFEREGDVVLPDVELVWWNLKGGRLERELLAGISLTVGANPDLAADQISAPEDGDEPADAPPPARGFPWIGLLCTALLLALGFVLVRHRKNLMAIARYRVIPEDPERDAWRHLRDAAASGDPTATFAAVLRWLDVVQPGAPGWRAAVLDHDGADARAHLAALEASIYGGGEPPPTRHTAMHLGKARRRFRRSSRPSHGPGPGLGPLNPH